MIIRKKIAFSRIINFLADCFQINFDISGTNMSPYGNLISRSPMDCQKICRATNGCFWFTWKLKNAERGGICSLISRKIKMISDYSTKGTVSGPAKCEGNRCF